MLTTESTPPKTEAEAETKYDLKVDGKAIDPQALEEATSLFKKTGLKNEQAQELVDFYVKQIQKIASPEALAKVIEAQNEKYLTALKADPEIGGKLDQVKADIGRAYDAIGNPALVKQFKDAMAESPEGNNPAFVKMLHAFAQKVIEGKHVSGGGPSPGGQIEPGKTMRPTAAQAMYPNLVRQ